MAKNGGDLSRRRIIQLFGAAGLAGVSPCTFEAEWLQVEHHQLRLPKWDLGAVRVGLVADLHIGGDTALQRAARALTLLVEQRPDLILIPGDFVYGWGIDAQRGVDRFMGLVADCGIPAFASLGNHDAKLAHAEVVAYLERHRIPALVNSSAEFQGLNLVGLDDCLFGVPDPGIFLDPRFEKNTIALVHEPDGVNLLPTQVSLMVSGHSHGGQVCLPFGIPIGTPELARIYKKGYYPHAPSPLYVTRGVGTVAIDVRLYCRPEVTILDCRSQ